MTKLKLKAPDLHSGEVLTREQMRNVIGGSGSGSSCSSAGTASQCLLHHTGCVWNTGTQSCSKL